MVVAMVLAVPTSGQAASLDLPLEWQVTQRNAEDWAEVKVAGTVPTNAILVEAKAELGAGLRRKATDWLVVARVAQFKDGKFCGRPKLAARGWYTLNVRFRKSAADPAVIGEAAVEHVGVGDVFVVAGQSNSSNRGQERQETMTGLVTAFYGKHWQLANDPQLGASGDAGSFMPPFGDAMAGKFKVPVGIIACGIAATSVREWLPKGATFPNPPTLKGRVRQLPGGEWESKGEAFDMFVTRMKQLGPKGFRAVLWHQGESDAEQPDPKRTLPGKQYPQYLEQIIRASRQEIGWDAPCFVALVSSHGREGRRTCVAARNRFGMTASPWKARTARRSGATFALVFTSAARACANMGHAVPRELRPGWRSRALGVLKNRTRGISNEQT